nr:ribonuclease H-like domain-containing protein [Tanacetum cinerariifolium]
MLADSKLPTTFWADADHLGKFDGKADEGFFIGYSLNSKAFRVFNSRTWIVEENLHIRFSENTPNVVGSGPDWLFNIDALTRIMNYEAIITGTQSNGFADYILLPLWTADPPFSQDSKSSHNVNNTNNINTISLNVNVVDTNEDNELSFDTNIPSLEDVSIFNYLIDDEDDGTMADMNKFGYNNPKVYVCQPLRFKDPYFPDRVYKVEKALYGLHQALRAWFTEVKTASTPIETQNPLLKDEVGKEVNVHMYRYQVNSKASHLYVIKRIF